MGKGGDRKRGVVEVHTFIFVVEVMLVMIEVGTYI